VTTLFAAIAATAIALAPAAPPASNTKGVLLRAASSTITDTVVGPPLVAGSSTAGPHALVIASSTTTGTITEYPSLEGWYGWQLVTADQLVGASMFWTAVATGSEPLLFAWVGFGVANGPLLHLANGNGAGAGLSLLVRALPPLTGVLGAYVGSQIDGGEGFWSSFSLGTVIGAVIGWQVTALPGALLDYVFLSWDETPEEPLVSVAPILVRTPEGRVAVGVGLRLNRW
jgi:hypothetical protein